MIKIKNNYYTPPRTDSLEVRTNEVICLSIDMDGVTTQEFVFDGEDYAW